MYLLCEFLVAAEGHGYVLVLLRCSRRSECSRGQGPEQWLWSFQSDLGCLRVVALSPANISREETREVNAQSRWGPDGESSGDGQRPWVFLWLHQTPHGLAQPLSWALDFSVTVKVRACCRAQGLQDASGSL